MNQKSRTPKPHILILKLTNELDLRIGKNAIVAPWCSGYHYCTFSFN